MKKILMFSAISLVLATANAFAACPCQPQKISCNPCEKPKITCCQPACPDQSYQGQCCMKKSIFRKIWNGTKTAYNSSFGAIYDTMMVPFR